MSRPFMYKFFCPRCGYYKECPTKEDWLIEKKHHKIDRCNLMYTPVKFDINTPRPAWVLARPEVALEMRKEWEESTGCRIKEE